MHSLRTALVLTLTAAAAAVAPAGAALAAEPLPAQGVTDMLPTSAVTGALPTQSVLGALRSSTSNGLAPLKHLTLDPLANSGTDPLDNALGTQIADFQPLSTAAATGPITRGGSLSTLPVVGQVASLLPG